MSRFFRWLSNIIAKAFVRRPPSLPVFAPDAPEPSPDPALAAPTLPLAVLGASPEAPAVSLGAPPMHGLRVSEFIATTVWE